MPTLPPVSYVQKAATAISAGISASVEVLSHSERIFRYATVGPADGAPGDLYLQNSCSCRDGARVRYIRSGSPGGTGEPASTLHCRAQATGASGSNTVPRMRSSKNPAHGRVFFARRKVLSRVWVGDVPRGYGDQAAVEQPATDAYQ